MDKLIKRHLYGELRESLEYNPVVALIGPRQCGKSTLAKMIQAEFPASLYLDLENPFDLAKLVHPEFFLSRNKDRLVCIDEVQRRPELFPLLRSLCDEWGDNGHFLILGSASRDLLRQSSESLAGRIAYFRLTPFLFCELADADWTRCLWRGGFPRAYLARSDKAAQKWLESFVTTFLERDLSFWREFVPETMRRLWRMLAHENGQTVNFSRLASALGVSDATITRTDDDAKPNQFEFRKADAVVNFQNVTFEYVGVKSYETNSLYFDNCTFTKYVYQNRVSGPIAVGMTGSTVVATNCLFDHNEYSSISGAANIKCALIRVENCTFDHSQQVNRNMPMLNLTPGDTIIVRGNVLHGDPSMDMVGGISVANLMGLSGDMYVLIENNEIDSCRYGINIQGSISEAIIRGNKVTNNRYVRNNDANNGGSGIAIYDASKSLNLKVSNNYFENNLWGVTVIGGGNINLGKIEVDGVALAEDDPEYNEGKNVFKDNGHDDILVDLAFASGTDYLTVYAQNNTWNVEEQTEELIEAVIDHQKDDASLGLAIFMPAYSEQTTGVSAIENVQPSGAAFDLMGRVVEPTAKGQLYIREGRKFIVR